MAMIRTITSVFTSVLLALLASAADAQNSKEVSYSYYLISCGKFVQHRQSPSHSDINNAADLFYVAGWLSAYDRLKPEEAIPEDTTLDDVMLRLDHYCHANPLSNLETGLFALEGEMHAPHAPAANGN